MMKMSVELKNLLQFKMMMQIWRISCKFFLLNKLFHIIFVDSKVVNDEHLSNAKDLSRASQIKVSFN